MTQQPLKYYTNWVLPSQTDTPDARSALHRLAGQVEHAATYLNPRVGMSQYTVNDADYTIPTATGPDGYGFWTNRFIVLTNLTASRTITLPPVQQRAGIQYSADVNSGGILIKDGSGNAATYPITIRGAVLGNQPGFAQVLLTSTSSGTFDWTGKTASLSMNINGTVQVINFTNQNFGTDPSALVTYINTQITNATCYSYFRYNPYSLGQVSVSLQFRTTGTGSSSYYVYYSTSVNPTGGPTFTYRDDRSGFTGSTYERINDSYNYSVTINTNYGYRYFTVHYQSIDTTSYAEWASPSS